MSDDLISKRALLEAIDNSFIIPILEINMREKHKAVLKIRKIIMDMPTAFKREESRMGDLISREDLLGTQRLLMTDIVENNPTAKFVLEQVLFDIEHAETAFDKEEVIKELQKHSHNYYPSIDHYCTYVKAVKLRDVIDIIEKGR